MISTNVRTRARLARLAGPACLALTAAALLGGCKPDRASRHPGDEVSADTDPAAALPEPTGDPIVFASVGVPHGAAITMIAVDPLGGAALSRDASGGVRLWPALDGSREPLVVPIRDPRSMALASDGAGGWTLALLDAAGGGRIVGVDESGKMQPLASLSPTDPLTDIVVMPGGKQLVAVGGDHVLRLLDPHGAELSRLDQAGLRAASLRVAPQAEGGPQVVALTAGEFDRGEGRFAVELLPLSITDAKLALAGQRQTVHLDSPPTVDNPSVSPDGRSAVFIQRQRLGGATWMVIAMQLEDGRQVSVNSQIPNGVQPRFGLLPRGRVLVDDGTGLGHVVDLQDRDVELTGLRSSPTINHLAATFVAGLRVAPASNWLAVHDLDSDDLTYLGYEQISVTDAGLSPSAQTVAWALSDRVAVERASDGDRVVVEVPGTRGHGQRFVEFLDEERLLMLDWAGGAQLVRWRDGTVTSAADLGNNIQTADFGRNGTGDGVLFVRTNLWQNPSVVEVSDGRFDGRYLTHASANLAGLLAPRDAALASWGAWTIDGAGKLRNFTLAQLRPGLDTEAALATGETLSFGTPEQFAVGADKTIYWVRTTGARPTLHLERGDASDELQLPAGFVSMIVPSREGRRIAIVQQRDPGQVVTVYDTRSLQPAWAQPIPAVNGMSWSDASEALAIPAMLGGGVVLNAEDGTAQTARCGLGFEVRRTPPVVQGFSNQLSVCEIP
ncbi:hypothetical protein DB30_05593 [Enhygromyxa salina]|uniref:Translocation protein TolB n=1 Tax=Enhygromyxa salina TaxID=215803 RepID=A0A0C2D5S2_9BACT|nr:hypothetical protein [Enhygromyxa salina]KIG15397.1 hypothetical protein DB30_05593 [Enhygromyxa salina]